MTVPALSISRRLRNTPFTDRVNTAGVKSYTVYNHMLLPTSFKSMEEDYFHLKKHVQVWDVSCQRQVSVKGPDAAILMQRLTPRNLTKMVVGQCYYIPIVDDQGGMLNDPVTLKLAEDHYWISIADGDLLLWVKALAIGFGLTVSIEEPDVFPLAIQGPKSAELLERVFGPAIHTIRFFRFQEFTFEGQSLIISRSGFSEQGGFEIYVNDPDLASPLWDTLFKTGQDLQVRAGCPNLIERVESGLLSFGNDMTSANTPLECGLGRFCQIENETNCIGHEALKKGAKEGPARQIRSIAIEGEPFISPCDDKWPLFDGEKHVGDVTSAVWSPDFKTNVALGMVNKSHWADGTSLTIKTPQGPRTATILEKCFTDRK
ncbi:MAG: dimethylsulfoniopropionate demethylase [Sneathiella sp.]|nr:dimethylsulfoniopropionate demethylase [Sneathiella sp.]